jgi:hypothetical protein
VTDEELERQLRRFHVPAPPLSLRARVVRDVTPSSGLRDFAIGWCVAAAVVAVVCTGTWLSMRARERRIDEVLATAPIAREVEEAVRLLGPRGRDVVRLRVLESVTKGEADIGSAPSDREGLRW